MMHSFSIIIPTKDRPVLLRRAVQSAQKERGAGAEIVVVDDHSQTPARDVLADLSIAELRIVDLPAGKTGIASGRNAGLAAATGKVVFFLDDDDQFIEGYCQRILRGDALQHDYGFASYLEQSGTSGTRTTGKIRFDEGAVPKDAPLRKRLCGFGMGFWIKAAVASEIGKVDETLSINEDTDYVCRLILAGKSCWYSAAPGVVLQKHDPNTSELGHITARTSATERSRCMLSVSQRYPALIEHLGISYLRHCVKAGAMGDAWRFVREQPSWRLRGRFALFAFWKSLCRTRQGKT